MNAVDRRAQILQFVNARKEVGFSEIRDLLPDVSEMTIRRDLEQLNRDNKIVRVLGGAKSVEYLMNAAEAAYMKRSGENAEKKAVIARKALQLIESDSTIFLGSGTTTTQLAKIIPNGNYFIVTTGMNCAIELSMLEDVSLMMLGGVVNKNSYSVYGSLPVQMLDDMSFSVAFLGVSGFVAGKGFCTSVAEDFVMRQKIMEHSEKTVILMDSSKVGRKGIYTFAPLDAVDYVISDDDLSPDVVEELEANNITVL